MHTQENRNMIWLPQVFLAPESEGSFSGARENFRGLHMVANPSHDVLVRIGGIKNRYEK